MIGNKLKPAWIEIITVSVAIIAICVSFRACSISQDALELSKKSFISENRPYLILQPVRNKGTGFFIELVLGEKETTLKGTFEIFNAGKSPAKNIRTNGIVVKSKNIKLSEDLQANIKPLPEISLGPGERRNMGFNLRIGYSSLERGKTPSAPPDMKVAETIRFRITLPLTYSSDLDAKNYRTNVTYEFPSFKEAYLIESIYE